MHLNAIVNQILLSWMPRRVGKRKLVYNCHLKLALFHSSPETGQSGNTAALCKEGLEAQSLVEQHMSINWTGINVTWGLERSVVKAASEIHTISQIIWTTIFSNLQPLYDL